MSKRILCMLLCAAMLLGGCVYRSVSDEGADAVVYRVSSADSGARLVRERLLYDESEKLTAVLTQALNSQPHDIGLANAFPKGVEILDLRIEKGVASVEMSPDYVLLEGLDKLLADSAMVLTLMAADEICSVDVLCGGAIVESGLSIENIAEADGLCGSYERTLKLYLPDEWRNSLVPISHTVSDDGSLSSEERVLSGLFEALEGGMENTRVLSVSTESGLCSIDLSEAFYGAEPTESFEGMLIIYSIVNSLCRVPGVDSVAISVEGYSVESYGGFRTVWPLGENISLISY